ncbi:putative phorsphotransbutyrlylase [Clostridium tetanomorphum]|nr:putative phorsphotransbutyrlylase [Clostridium tetanomorphum]
MFMLRKKGDNLKRYIYIILCLLWMVFIFYNSSNTGIESNKKSHEILNDIKNIYSKIGESSTKISENNSKVSEKKHSKSLTKEENKKNYYRNEKFNLFLRKNAHAFEYLVLALLLANIFYAFGVKGKKAIIYILFICLFYAVTDEYHQLFVRGRTSSVEDVIIDFCGSLSGIFLYYLIFFKKRF